MTKKAPIIAPGEIVYPSMTGYRMVCCDCALAHDMKFEIVRVTDETAPVENDEVVNDPTLKVRMRAWRNNRSTARHRKNQGIAVRHPEE